MVVFPGGGGHSQTEAIGEAGAAAVKAFVKGGGGYAAVLCRACLATCGYPWSLKLIDADTVDSEQWEDAARAPWTSN